MVNKKNKTKNYKFPEKKIIKSTDEDYIGFKLKKIIFETKEGVSKIFQLENGHIIVMLESGKLLSNFEYDQFSNILEKESFSNSIHSIFSIPEMNEIVIASKNEIIFWDDLKNEINVELSISSEKLFPIGNDFIYLFKKEGINKHFSHDSFTIFKYFLNRKKNSLDLVKSIDTILTGDIVDVIKYDDKSIVLCTTASIHLWDIHQEIVIDSRAICYAECLLKTSNKLYVGQSNGKIKTFGNSFQTFKIMGISDAVYSLAEYKNKILTTGGNTIKVWSCDSNKCIKTEKIHEFPITSILFISEFEFLSSSFDGTIKKWIIVDSCSIILVHFHLQKEIREKNYSIHFKFE